MWLVVVGNASCLWLHRNCCGCAFSISFIWLLADNDSLNIFSWILLCDSSIKVTQVTSVNSYRNECCKEFRTTRRTVFVSNWSSWLWFHACHYDVLCDSDSFFFIAGTFFSAGVSWTNVNSQAIQKKPWIEKTQTFIRGGRQAEQRNSSQVNVNLSIFFLVIWKQWILE